MADVSLIDRIREQVDSLPEETVKAEYAAVMARKQKELAKAKERRANMTEEQKAKAKERYKTYSSTPEAKERAKAYREKPEVKEKSKAREKERRAKTQELIRRAKELGLDKDPAVAPPQ